MTVYQRERSFREENMKMRLFILDMGLCLLILSACASEKTLASYDPMTDLMEENCGALSPVSESDLRLALYQAKKQWDSITAHVDNQRRMEILSDEQVHQFALQDDEFTKYYTNALTLYLYGDLSADLCRSLLTVRELIIIAGSCYPGILEQGLRPFNLEGSCESLESPEDDTNRALLYRIKSQWDEFSIEMMGRQIRGGIPAESGKEFEKLTKEFRDTYSDACMLYLNKQDWTEEFSRTLDTLEHISEQSMGLLQKSNK